MGLLCREAGHFILDDDSFSSAVFGGSMRCMYSLPVFIVLSVYSDFYIILAVCSIALVCSIVVETKKWRQERKFYR